MTSKGALRQFAKAWEEQRGIFPSNSIVFLCQKLDVLTQRILHASLYAKHTF